MLLFDNRWLGAHGIGRFAQEVFLRLGDCAEVSNAIPKLHPLDPVWLSIEIARKQPEVFFSPGYNPPLYTSSPFVFTIHDLNHLHPFGNDSYLKHCYYKFLIRPACHRAFKVLTVSEFSKNEIINWSGVADDKVVNVGNAASSLYCEKGERYDPGVPYLLYIGNHKRHKNVISLLKAFAQCQFKGKLKLLLSGAPETTVLALCRELKIIDQVEFLGELSESRLPEIYRGAKALLIPSLYEGFGLPIIEAMACGTPVITSNISAMPETAGGAAYLVDPTDTQDIANAMVDVVSNKQLTAELREKGLQRVKDFSWDITANKISEILQSARG